MSNERRLTPAQLLYHILSNPRLSPSETEIWMFEKGPDKIVEVRTRLYGLHPWRRFRIKRDFNRIRKTFSFSAASNIFAIYVKWLVEINPTFTTARRVDELRICFRSNEGFPILTFNPEFRLVNENLRRASLRAIDLYGILDPAKQVA